MENYIFKAILFLFIISCGLVRFPFMKKYKQNINARSLHTTFEKIKVFLAWLGMCFVPFIYIFTGLLNRYDFSVPFIIRILFSAGLALDVYFFYIIHKELGANWSPILEIKTKQNLIKTGVYKYIRHPMYTQSWLWVIFQGIVSANWFVLTFGVLTWGFMYFTRVFSEENMMVEEFNEEYVEYLQHTGRLLPKLSWRR